MSLVIGVIDKLHVSKALFNRYSFDNTVTGNNSLQLPIKIDIIKHQNECDGKSTSAHAAVLAPDDVRVFTYPCIPDYPDPSKVRKTPKMLTALTLCIHHLIPNQHMSKTIWTLYFYF